MARKPTGAPLGRPSQLKDPARSAILTAIRHGAPFCHAAGAAGVSYDCFRGWRRQGRADIAAGKESAFAAFFRDVEKARAQLVVENLKVITRASKKTWTAAAWKLERLHPDRFALQRDVIRDLLRQQTALEELVRQLLAEKTAKPGEPAA